MPEFAAVTCGSFCVRSLRLPRDLSDVIAALRDPDSQVKPVVCAQASADCEPAITGPITVPPLASRPDEFVAETASSA
jgi:hypothetical protein